MVDITNRIASAIAQAVCLADKERYRSCHQSSQDTAWVMASSGFGFTSRKQRKPEPKRVNQVKKPIYRAMQVQKPEHGLEDRHYLMDSMMNWPLRAVNVHPNSEHKDYVLNAKLLNARIPHLVVAVLQNQSNRLLQVR
jgi:hypothetical protein